MRLLFSLHTAPVPVFLYHLSKMYASRHIVIRSVWEKVKVKKIHKKLLLTQKTQTQQHRWFDVEYSNEKCLYKRTKIVNISLLLNARNNFTTLLWVCDSTDFALLKREFAFNKKIVICWRFSAFSIKFL